MELDHAEVAELARFFARRFPGRTQRRELARAAGLRFEEPAEGNPVEAWIGLLSRAAGRPALRRLVRAALAARPEDENLRELADILLPPRRPGRLAAAAAVAAGALVAVGVAVALHERAGPTEPGLVSVHPAEAPALPAPAGARIVAPAEAAADAATRGIAPDDVADADDARVADADEAGNGGASEVARTAPTGGARAEAATAAPAGAADAATAEAPRGAAATAPDEAATTASPRPEGTPPAAPAEPARARGRCTTEEPGALVGYWYAGAEPPGRTGEVVTMERSVYVRADYPDRHNGYDARAPVRCALLAGDRVRLGEPIHVPGDRWWVPLHDGGLIEPVAVAANE